MQFDAAFGPSTPGKVAGAPPQVLADARRDARSRRIGVIRKRVAAGAVALFIAVWVLITVRLATGHDPALAAAATRRATVALPATSTASASGDPSSSTAPDSGGYLGGDAGTPGATRRSNGANASSGDTGNAAAPVTTRQS
jgi:hypothetical protein